MGMRNFRLPGLAVVAAGLVAVAPAAPAGAAVADACQSWNGSQPVFPDGDAVASFTFTSLAAVSVCDV